VGDTPVNGVLLIDKPVGPSSNAVLQTAKRLLGAKRAGHTGTLDPLASGLLVIGLGEATKFAGALLGADKAYRARVKLGERTETGDAEGPVLERSEVSATREDLLAVLDHFRGEIEQLPPRHAAIKYQGRPLYAYARRGEHVPRSPRPVVIRLMSYVKVPRDAHRRKITRRAVFARDGWACQYCGSRSNLTVDHVIPRSKGGNSSWENIVASCAPCNRRKGDRLPRQAGMHPRRAPRTPRAEIFIHVASPTIPAARLVIQ